MIFLKKDERQALRTRKHYMQIFLEWFYWYFYEISMFENYVGISHHLKMQIIILLFIFIILTCSADKTVLVVK